MLLKRLNRGVLKKCNKPYKNPQFLVAKKLASTYKLINAAIKMNFITLQDANMPLLVNKFLEEFAKYQCASLIDFFSRYNQLTLNVKSKDIIAFITPLSLLKMTTPPQGATNLIAQFIQVIITILKDLFLAIAILFIDNIRVKGLYTDYNKELKLLKICRFIFKHLQNLNRALN